MTQRSYRGIVSHYENCLERHGDCNKGVDWPNIEDAMTRYRVMLDVVRDGGPNTLLDFGCGAAHMFEYMKDCGQYVNLSYCGLDLSPKFVELCRKKHPELDFFQLDLLQDEDKVQLPQFDYIVLNGVFTEKLYLPFAEMEEYFQKLVTVVYEKCNKGIAFNVMSKEVDWERDDLFHLSTDSLIGFLVRNLSRHFIIRNDYGLYEYTVYLYRNKWEGRRL